MSFDELAAAVWAAGVLVACGAFAYLIIRGQFPAQAKATIKRYRILSVLVLLAALAAWPVMILLVPWKRRLNAAGTDS